MGGLLFLFSGEGGKLVGDWKQTKCGMIVKVTPDGRYARGIDGRLYEREGRTKLFHNLDGSPIRHNPVMARLARGER